MSATQNEHYVDATYILKNGTAFNSVASYPHENHFVVQWQEEGHAEPYLEIEFVYFGHYKNRLVFHEVEIDTDSKLMI